MFFFIQFINYYYLFFSIIVIGIVFRISVLEKQVLICRMVLCHWYVYKYRYF